MPKAILAKALVSLAICFINIIRSLTTPVAPEWAAMVDAETTSKTTAKQIFATDDGMTISPKTPTYNQYSLKTVNSWCVIPTETQYGAGRLS